MMTRDEITSSAEQLVKAIESAGISELTDINAEQKTLQDYLLSFKEYNILAEQFSDGALYLESALGFSQLRDPNPWIEMSKQDASKAESPFHHLPGILDTLSSISNLLANEKESVIERGNQTLTLIVLGSSTSNGSPPSRICEAIESIELFYQACGYLNKTPDSDLSVFSCDSGKDMYFDIQGDAQLIEAVKDLILSIWERVVFYRNRSLQDRISLLTNSLPALDSIAELEMNGSLSASEGERVRTAIAEGAKKFLSSGAIIKEIRNHSTFDERSLMALDKKAPKENNGHAKNGFSLVSPEQDTTPSPPIAHYTESDKYEEPEPVAPSPPPAPSDSIEDDLSWDGILEDDLKTLRELIDKTKRNEEEHN